MHTRAGGPRPVLPRPARPGISWVELAKEVEAAQNTYMGFVKHMWPAFIEGDHHRVMADAFNRIATGELKRLIINMPPRHTKSEFASYLFPAWFLGQYPNKKIIQTAHTAELAVGFGRKVRNLIKQAKERSSTASRVKVMCTALSSDGEAMTAVRTDVLKASTEADAGPHCADVVDGHATPS